MRGRVRMRACLHKQAHTHTCKHTRTLARAYMCVPEHVVNVCVCVGVCVRAVRVCVGESVSVGASLNLSMFACTPGCARASGCVCTRTRVRKAGTCGSYRSAGGAGRPRVRGCGSVRSALGVARVGRRRDVGEPCDDRAVGCATCAHVRGVVDAVSGAIYVIGGSGGRGGIDYNDVWASTDGGARAGLGRGELSGGTPGGYSGRTQGY